MKLLCQITINDNIYYISDKRHNIEHPYEDVITAISQIDFKPEMEIGGVQKMNYGDISVINSFFADKWAIPIQIPISIYFTENNESDMKLIIQGYLYQSSIGEVETTFKIYEQSTDIQVLTTGTNYDNETVDLPMVIGRINHIQPIRLLNVSNKPTYHKASISGNPALRITEFSNPATGYTNITTSITHNLAAGNKIKIEGTQNYDGETTVFSVISTTIIRIAKTYVSETAKGHIITDNHYGVYDDGVPIPGNVTDNGNGTFSLSANPVGEVTISGLSQYQTMFNIFDLCCSKLGKTANKNNATDTGILSYYLSGQIDVISFISSLISEFHHFAYTDYSQNQFVLIDGNKDSGNEFTITANDFFGNLRYTFPAPIKKTGMVIRNAYAINNLSEGRAVEERDENFSFLTGIGYGNDYDIPAYIHKNDYDIPAYIKEYSFWLGKPKITFNIPFDKIGSNFSLNIGDIVKITDSKKHYINRRYKHWRIQALTTAHTIFYPNIIYLYEIQMFHDFSGNSKNIAPTGTASAKTTYGSYTPDRLNDGNEASIFLNQYLTDVLPWIQVSFQNPVSVNCIRFKWVNDYYPKNIQMLGSNADNPAASDFISVFDNYETGIPGQQVWDEIKSVQNGGSEIDLSRINMEPTLEMIVRTVSYDPINYEVIISGDLAF